jgi:hypothetical protein
MTNKQERSAFGLVRLSKQNQNPKKFGPIPCIWKQAPKRPAAAFWGDSDGDGVYNGFDCQPHNRRKQGPQHEDQLGMGEDHEGEKQASENLTMIAELQRRQDEAADRQEARHKLSMKNWRERHG